MGLLLFVLGVLPVCPLSNNETLGVFLPQARPILKFTFLILLAVYSTCVLVRFGVFNLFTIYVCL